MWYNVSIYETYLWWFNPYIGPAPIGTTLSLESIWQSCACNKIIKVRTILTHLLFYSLNCTYIHTYWYTNIYLLLFSSFSETLSLILSPSHHSPPSSLTHMITHYIHFPTVVSHTHIQHITNSRLRFTPHTSVNIVKNHNEKSD